MNPAVSWTPSFQNLRVPRQFLEEDILSRKGKDKERWYVLQKHMSV